MVVDGKAVVQTVMAGGQRRCCQEFTETDWTYLLRGSCDLINNGSGMHSIIKSEEILKVAFVIR